jgi:hypothetical protein
VRDDYSLEERVIKAVNAGTDLIVFSNEQSHDPELGVKIHAIEQAYGKVRLLKRRLAEHDLPGKW